MSEQAPDQIPLGTPSLFRRVFDSSFLPVFVTGLLITFCLTVAWFQFMPPMSGNVFNAPKVVSFDPVKFINAQRAAASILATRPNADLALTMTQVANQAEAVIREEANGALVLIKQSLVLQEDVPDITDKVLRRFGLSTQVPTVSTNVYGERDLERYAPTDSALSSGRYQEDERLEYRGQALNLEDQIRRIDEQRNLLP